MPLDWAPFIDFVRRRDRFFLTTHVRPDADGLGSVQALGEALESLGKKVDRVIPSRIPPQYEFLDPDRRISVFAPPGDQWRPCDALIVLDTGTWNQLADVGPFVRTFAGEKAVIDHHGTSDDLGAVRFVNVGAESTGRLAAEAIQSLGVTLTPTMAANLLAAVATDTGWFRHPSTTKETFALASELVAAGARVTPIFEAIYETNTLPRLKLRSRALDRVTLAAENRIAYSWIRLADYQETGAVPSDTEDMINMFAGLDGAEVRLLFIEQREGGVKVSFRARTFNVAKIAEQFGGGGHKLAAGATVPGPFEVARDRVLKAAEDAVLRA